MESTNDEEEKKSDNQSIVTNEFLQKIQNLQALVKREYAKKITLNELKNHISSQLENINIKITENKIKILESKLKKSEDNKEEVYILDKAPKVFYNSESMYIEPIFVFLRKYQNFMYKILINSDSTEQKKTLAQFTSNFLYTNIFNVSSIDEELLILITRTLKNEISNIQNTDESNIFLNDSINKYLLLNLIDKDDVKTYFSLIVNNLIEKIESREDNQKLIFSTDQLVEIIKAKNEKLKKLKNSKNNKENKDNKKLVEVFEKERKITGFNIDQETFFKVYIIDLTVQELKKIYLGYEDQKNELNNYVKIDYAKIKELIELQDYIFRQFNNIRDDLMYSNTELLENVYKSKYSTEVLILFKNNFCIVVDLINQLFENLNNNILSIPDSIKYVCKIILMLFKKYHPKLSVIELNSFISEFFFNLLLEPIFTNSDYNGLLASRIVSKVTKNNITIIYKIIQKLVSGYFFQSKKTEESNFTIFNRYFIEIMPKVNLFFESLTKIDLPPIIEKIIYSVEGYETPIDDFVPSDYVYDYFKERPNEKIRYFSICYTVNDVLNVFDIIKKNEKEFFNQKVDKDIENEYKYFLASYSKIKSSSHMDNILNAKDKDSKEIKVHDNNNPDHIIMQKRKTFCLSVKIFYSKESEIFNKNNLEPFYLNPPKDDNNRLTNIIIQIKNSLSALLYQFKTIPKYSFFGLKIKNTETFLNSAYKICSLGYYLMDSKGQVDWHIVTLQNSLKELLTIQSQTPPDLHYNPDTSNPYPHSYTENDYQLIYSELEKDLIDSIRTYNIDTLIELQDTINNANYLYKLTEKNIKQIEQLGFNKKVQNFLDDCPVEAYMKLENNKLGIISGQQRAKLKYIDSFLFENEPEKGKQCHNIFQFISKFPNICNLQNSYDEELYVIEKNYNIPKAINDYFQIIKSCIKSHFKRRELREIIVPKQKNSLPNVPVTETEKEKKEQSKKDKKKKGNNKSDNEENEEDETFEEKELTNRGIEKILKEVSTYIMNRLYDKLYPLDPDEQDIKIYQNCFRLSWVEPRHLCKGMKHNIERLIHDAIHNIKKLDNVKNPAGKLNLVNKSLDIIIDSLNFVAGKKVEGGVDDMLPLLIFTIIKAQPKRFNSNIGFIEYYYENINLGPDAQRFSMLCGVKEKLLNIDYDDLFDVEKDEFIRQCEIASGLTD